MKQSSIALHMAHTLHADEHKIILGVSRQQVISWQDCLRMGWYFVRFRAWLSNGIVTFSFFKKDGSIREAKGTTNLLLIPLDKRPKGTTHPSGGWGLSLFTTSTSKNGARSLSPISSAS